MHQTNRRTQNHNRNNINNPQNLRPRIAVGNLSGNRCESDCRSRGHKFDPGLVPNFLGDRSEIISTVILPSNESFKKGCCQLQAKVCAQSIG